MTDEQLVREIEANEKWIYTQACLDQFIAKAAWEWFVGTFREEFRKQILEVGFVNDGDFQDNSVSDYELVDAIVKAYKEGWRV